jgi:V-type H+-transporting ATPase subunit a
MGVGSVLTGLMYNDIFSKSLNIMGSGFTARHVKLDDIKHHEILQLSPDSKSGAYTDIPYPLGIDPIWQLSTNKISFLNSYKMKNSIVLGVAQMMFGVMLSLANHTYFKRPLNVFCMFVPELLFLLALFGYLVALIFLKWVWFNADTAACAPSVLITIINMCLLKPNEFPGCPPYMFDAQAGLQKVLLLIVLICIPWLLLLKPLILYRRNKAREQARAIAMNSSLNGGEEGMVLSSADSQRPAAASSSGGHGGHDDDEHFDFGEIFIHQAIHTIEYALGSISHTASYLRLWALSLAHAQLSEVCWGMVFTTGLSSEEWTGSITLYVCFAMWAVLTVGVLLFMEALSAFLHCLRLHWVEFQSKFYAGEGVAFMPFCFKAIIDEAMVHRE